MAMVKYPDKSGTARGKRMTSGRSTRESESVVSEFEGALVRQKSAFSYFMLVAFEACGILRFALLLLAWPLSEMAYHLISEELAVKILIFVAMAGLKACEIESVARAVLPKFYMDDLNSETWRLFSSFGRKVVVTYSPRIMVEPFLKGHLSADEVIGTEIEVNRYGRATGFLKVPGVLLGAQKRIAVKALFGDEAPTVGLGPDVGSAERSFMSLCKERYVVPRKQREDASTPADEVCKPAPIIFHDGRLVQRPTPSMALLILLWIPLGVALAMFRVICGLILPVWVVHHTTALFGGRITVKGSPPAATAPSNTPNRTGVLFVCTHRTLMDPVVLSVVLKRRIPAVTYSISRLSEILSPIPTVRLIRDREKDAAKIRRLLQKGDLVVCPEGTTCREPFLLRFSALFAELTDQIVPVAMNYRVSLFHGTTARGFKAMDPFFFFMNPSPLYEVTFLSQLPHELTCSGGKSSHDVANYVQRILAGTLGFQCTQFTRKDKYRTLAGNDGIVRSPGPASSSSSFFSTACTHLLQSIPHS